MDTAKNASALQPRTFQLVKLCVASFVLHKCWSDEITCVDNLLGDSSFWSDQIPFTSCVVTGFPLAARFQALHSSLGSQKMFFT